MHVKVIILQHIPRMGPLLAVDSSLNMEMESPMKTSIAAIHTAKENRIAEAFSIKDKQICILTEQNNKLLEAINEGEEALCALQLEKLHTDEENRHLRESNFNVQSKARVRDDELESNRNRVEDLDTKLKVVSSQHSELLKMLETEESKNVKLTEQLEDSQSLLRDLQVNHATLTRDLNSKTEIVENISKRCEHQNNEINLLQREVKGLQNKHNDSQIKASVEIESLQDQLRVRKEKQYQLLEKLQNQEEARRRAEDQISSLEELTKSLHAKMSNAETELQLEISSNLSHSDEIKRLTKINEALHAENTTVKDRAHTLEDDRLRIQVEARESNEKLREMAEKVFQLLERLKLAELGKNRSMDALRGREEEVNSLKKKNGILSKEKEKQEKQKDKFQSEKKIIEEQMKDLKKQNLKLGQKCKEEARLKIRMDDERKEAEEKVKTLNGRVSMLLNKLQVDEAAKSKQKEEIDKLQNQLKASIQTFQKREEELEKCVATSQSLSEDLNKSAQELDATKIKFEALQQLVNEQDEMQEQSKKREKLLTAKHDGGPLLAGGRLRFFIESKPTLGIFSFKAKCPKDRQWLEANDCNLFMRKANKSKNKQDLLLHKIAETYGIILTCEEKVEELQKEERDRKLDVEKLEMKLKYLHDKLSQEEDSKRRTLLRYINAVKVSVSLGEAGCEKDREEVGRVGAGRINLPEVNLTDEEVYAISALLHKNETIAELNLQGNMITDEGCRSLSSVLSGPSCLRNIDLRRNKISTNGIKLLVEALERSNRVRHVHVHVGGKIEAKSMDTEYGSNESSTICIVDVRDNSKPEDSELIKEEMFGLPVTFSQNPLVTKPKSQHPTTRPNKATNEAKRRKAQQYYHQLKQHKAKDEEKEIRENGWNGRVGGLEVSTNANCDSARKRQIAQESTGGTHKIHSKKEPCNRDEENNNITHSTSFSPFG